MKTKIVTLFAIGCLCCTHVVSAQPILTATIADNDGNPVSNATVRLWSTNQRILVQPDGTFRFNRPTTLDTLIITHVGFLDYKVGIDESTTDPLKIHLLVDKSMLQEVEVNTGYYSIPKERATGAFTHIDNTLLNRSVSTNILDRLEGVTNGLLFDRRNLTGENVNGDPELRIRGLSTIEANSAPLIVIDNFPYEGDINNLDPNMVESVTVLRDAAAASIWGARAGNGVIVISTKQGKYNQGTTVSLTSNLDLREKPDLFYNQSYLPAATIMEIQKELFERGSYREQNQTYIPSYVELLIKRRDGLISESDFLTAETRMRNTDLRQDALDYLYRSANVQQYALNISGGSPNYRYALAGGYHKNMTSVIGTENDRLNLSLRNTFKVNDALELDGGVWYTQRNSQNNGLTFTSVGSGPNRPIYDGLINADGTAAVTGSTYRHTYRENAERMGLYDWMYRPLDEIDLVDASGLSREFRLTGGGSYSIYPGIKFLASYQYVLNNTSEQTIYSKESHYVRNLVNRFTQQDGTQAIPYGGILEYEPSVENQSHSGRVQLNVDRTIAVNHRVVALAGGEIRQDDRMLRPGLTLYDYDLELLTANGRFDFDTRFPTRPSGSARIPNSTIYPGKNISRYISYFGNVSYAFDTRYTFSGSLRWDGSNLVGVKTNQRGTALWSVGGSWQLSEEEFFRTANIPYARIRVTYGSAGNIDKSQSYYPTIAVGNNSITDLRQSTLLSPGNPSLRWEHVNTFNVGVDVRSKNNRLSASFDYYHKNAKYLLGDNMMDPTTGITVGSPYKINYGGMMTKGWDFQLNSTNTNGWLKWKSVLLLNHDRNEITEYNGPERQYADDYLISRVPERGKSVDVLYAFPWYGLSGDNGLPIMMVDGYENSDIDAYREYYLNYPIDGLINAGVVVPKLHGSLMNTFEWKGFSASLLLAFKFGHVFRRKTIGPGQEYNSSGTVYHTDFFNRWKLPGDEKRTDVPAALPSENVYLSRLYTYSQAVISKGDLVRIQDIRFSYALDKIPNWPRRLPSMQLYTYVRNLGILWRANTDGIDPDYPNSDYPASASIAVGIQITFK